MSPQRTCVQQSGLTGKVRWTVDRATPASWPSILADSQQKRCTHNQISSRESHKTVRHRVEQTQDTRLACVLSLSGRVVPKVEKAQTSQYHVPLG